MASELAQLIRTLDTQIKAGSKRGAHGPVITISVEQADEIREYLWRYLDLLQ